MSLIQLFPQASPQASPQTSPQAVLQPLPSTDSTQSVEFVPFQIVPSSTPPASPVLSSPASPLKRGRGRPRKVLSPEEEAALFYKQQHKRGRGRPKKVLTPEEQAKVEAELEYKKVHPRKRGRPRKVKSPEEEQATPSIPKKRGRPEKEKPEKEKLTVAASGSSKKKGRPKKEPHPNPYTDDYFHFPSAAKGGVRKGKYFYPVAYILLRYLPFKTGNPVILTGDQLLEALGFVNSEYSQRRNINAGKDAWMYTWFFQRTDIILIPALKRQLEALTRLGVIRYEKTQRIYDSQEEPHLASQEEAEDIKEAELEVLDEMEFDSVSEVIMKGKSKTFYTRILEKLKEFDPKYEDIKKYYYCYAVWILKEYDPLSEEDYLKWKQRMNDLIIAMFRKYIDSFYHHSNDKAASAAVQGKDAFHYQQSFVDKQNELVTRFLKL